MCRLLLASTGSESTKEPLVQETFIEALEMMERGGPDYTKIIKKKRFGNTIFLGHNRLSILDLDDRSSQPMGFQDEEGEYWLLFNGEIYNYRELGADFDDLVTTGDTEVLLRNLVNYLDWDNDIVRERLRNLNGEFSFVLVTPTKIIAYRDPSGVKPLYICEKDGDLVMSSEIRPILKLAEWVPERKELYNYLQYGFNPDTGTPFEEIFLLPPGEIYTFNLKTKTGSRRKVQMEKDIFVDKEDVADAISESVKERLISDVPVSLTLSGGLDSSILCHLMKEHGAKFKAYCLSMEGDENDEVTQAMKVAKHYGIDLVNIHITEEEIFESMDDIIDRIEEPTDKGSLIPTYFLAKNIEEKVTLIGEGADECFGGYSRYQKFEKWKKEDQLNVDRIMKDFYEIFSVDEFVSPFKSSGFRHPILPGRDDNYLNEMDLMNEIPYYHTMRIDKMMMSFGIEARVPYLDHRVTSLSLDIPAKMKSGPEKKILREAFRGKIPDWILDTPKRALKIPYEKYVTNPKVKEEIYSNPLNLVKISAIKYRYDHLSERNSARGLWNLYLLNKIIKSYGL
jgi:asparagine synthase (glutamine-hydrolysing)